MSVTESWESMPATRMSAAETRRRLKKVFDEAGIKPAEAARLAGMSSANAIYNLFSGRSRSLSAGTIERLARVVPGVTAAILGPTSGSLEVSARSVQVKAAAQAGKLLASFDLPLDEQFEAPVPISAAARACGAYGVLVRYPGFDKVYKAGSILVCMPTNRYEGSLATGTQVVLERLRDRKVEVTVRELQVSESSAFLWLRSDNPHCYEPVMMPWPSDGTKMWKVREDRFNIAGVVIGAWQNVESE